MVQITCTSTVDCSVDFLRELQIPVVPFYFELNEKIYQDDSYQSVSYSDFYQAMKEGALTHTSQPNVKDYLSVFQPILERGDDILHIEFSSGLSGALQSAKIAKEELLKTYPQRRVEIIDSLCASSGYGLLVAKAKEKQLQNASLDELVSYVTSLRQKIQHWFFSTDLSYYIRGGRISKLSGWFGTVLKICPLLTVNRSGQLVPKSKEKGKANVLRATLEKMISLTEDGKDYHDGCFISYTDENDAKTLRAMVEESFPHLKNKIKTFPIGPVIGAHSGPGTVALFFVGKERE